MTRKQWDAMTPAQQTMWTMQTGCEPPAPKDQPTNQRAQDIQEATEDFQDTMAKVWE